MSDQARIHRYFPGTNTGNGYISFFNSVLSGMERIFVLKGAPGTGKSTLLKSIGIAMLDRGFNVEYLHCSGDNNSLDGIIIPEIKVAIIDSGAPHVYEPKAPGVIEELVNLGDCWNTTALQRSKEQIVEYNKSLDALLEQAQQGLKKAETLRKEIRKAYAKETDNEILSKLSKQLLEEIFQQEPLVRHLFGSAITPRGRINFLLNITEPWTRRYILRGLPGSGTTEIIEQVMKLALERCLRVDVYHDPLEVERLEAVIVPQLDLAVVNIEQDQEFYSFRSEDRVINFSEYLDQQQVEKTLSATLVERERYQDFVQKAVEKLAQAKQVTDKLEGIYTKAMNFDAVDELKESILNKILATAVTVKNRRGRHV